MTAYRLPITSADPHYAFVVELDGENYELAFDWNARAGSWHLAVSQDDNTSLAAGLKCVVGMPMLRKLSDEDAPPGELVFVDTAGNDADPRRDDLGARVLLYYYDEEEISGP